MIVIESCKACGQKMFVNTSKTDAWLKWYSKKNKTMSAFDPKI